LVEVLGDARRAVDLICPEEVARVSRMRSQPVATALAQVRAVGAQ
jgi:hypothetical protein